MNMIVLVLMMAVTVEALIEYAKTFGKAIIEKQWKTAATQAGGDPRLALRWACCCVLVLGRTSTPRWA